MLLFALNGNHNALVHLVGVTIYALLPKVARSCFSAHDFLSWRFYERSAQSTNGRCRASFRQRLGRF